MTSKENINQMINYIPYVAVVMHLFLLLNWQFTLWPEMMVYPYLINNDFVIYKEFINPYPPSLIFSLSLLTGYFGYSVIIFKIITWGLIVIIDCLIYRISLSLTKNSFHSSLALIFFIILSMPFAINGLWFDLVLTPVMLLSILYFNSYINNRKFKNIIISSSLLALSVFIKQSAAIIYLPYILLLIISKIKLNKIILALAVPIALLLIIHILYFYNINVLSNYLYWNFMFPILNASNSPGYILFPTLKQLVVVLSLVGIFTPLTLAKKVSIKKIILIAIFLLSFAYPRFDYFHLIPLLSLLSLLIATNIINFQSARLPVKLISITSALLILSFTLHYYLNNYHKSVRFYEPEIIAAADMLRSIASSSEIYILNGPDQLLPMSGLLPIKPWIDEFPWYLESNDMQNIVVNSLKIIKPMYVVYKPYSNTGKYDIGSYRPSKIVEYIEINYVNKIQLSDTLWLKIRKDD